MSESTEPSGHALLVNFANEYSGYARADLSEEVSRLDEFMQECIAKMDELSSLVDMTEFEQKDWSENSLPSFLEQTSLLNEILSKRLDALRTVIINTREILDKVEEQINQTDSGSNSSASGTSSLRSVLNYFKKPDPQPQEAPIAKPAWNK